jgi:predicted enzyme related to lactoylglutathione lyase
MKVKQIGSERLSVFPHQKPSVGGEIIVPRTALPPGMGFYPKIRDTEGNVVGLHALA